MVVNPFQSATVYVSTAIGQVYMMNTTNSSYSPIVLSSDLHRIDQVIPLNRSHILSVDRDQNMIKLITLNNATAAKTLLCKKDGCCEDNIRCLSSPNIHLGQVAIRAQDPYRLIFENGSSIMGLNLNNNESNSQLLFPLAEKPTESVLSWDDDTATITSIAPHSKTEWKYSRYNSTTLETIYNPIYFPMLKLPATILSLNDKYLLFLSDDQLLVSINMRSNVTAKGCTDQLSTIITFTTNNDNCKFLPKFHSIAIDGEYIYALEATLNFTLLIFKYSSKYQYWQ